MNQSASPNLTETVSVPSAPRTRLCGVDSHATQRCFKTRSSTLYRFDILSFNSGLPGWVGGGSLTDQHRASWSVSACVLLAVTVRRNRPGNYALLSPERANTRGEQVRAEGVLSLAIASTSAGADPVLLVPLTCLCCDNSFSCGTVSSHVSGDQSPGNLTSY